MASDPSLLKTQEPLAAHALSTDFNDPYDQAAEDDHSELSLNEHIKTVVTSITVDHKGTTVYFKGRLQPTQDLPPLLFIHDLGEHSGLYREISSKFLALGYSVYGYDLRGHGRSGRRMGHAPSFSSMVKDLLQVSAWVKHQESGHAPIFIAQGIGSLIAMRLASQLPAYCQGLVLCAPSIDLINKVSWYQRFFIKACADFMPLTRLPLKMIPKFAEQLKYSDRHSETLQKISYFPRITAIFTEELLSAIKQTQDSFFEFTGPTLVLCPTDDKICSYELVKKLAKHSRNQNLQLVDLKNSGHHILTENAESSDGRDMAIAILKEWLHKITLQTNSISSAF